MELTHEEKERLLGKVEVSVTHLWQKVVEEVNKYLAAEQFYPELREDFWDVAPTDVRVKLVDIFSPHVGFNLLERHIWVRYSPRIVLQGVGGRGEGFSLLLLATHSMRIEYYDGMDREWLLDEVTAFWWRCGFTLGWCRLYPVIYPNLPILAPQYNGKMLLPAFSITEEHLNPYAIRFIANTIMLFSSSTAVRLRNLASSVVFSILQCLRALRQTTWQLRLAGVDAEVYAHIHHVDVPASTEIEEGIELSLGVKEGRTKTTPPPAFWRSVDVELEGIKLVVEFFADDGTSLNVWDIDAKVEISIDLAKPTKDVRLQIAMMVDDDSSVKAADVPPVLFEFKDFRELPLVPSVDPYPVFTKMMCSGLKKVFDMLGLRWRLQREQAQHSAGGHERK